MEAKFQNCGQRISIVGTSGSGKTTLAKNISQQLQIPHIELDALHWEPNAIARHGSTMVEYVIATSEVLM